MASVHGLNRRALRTPTAKRRLFDPLVSALQTNRSLALDLLCLGVLMIVLDTTIVAVALPSIGSDLHIDEFSVTWIVNSYMICFGGFLLLGGRLGDLYGARRMFLAGIAAFTAASLACGVAPTFAVLIAARAAQGVGGAVVMAVSLALIINLFPEPAARARAMGIYGFVCAIGGSIGELSGGVITRLLDWRWVFLVNIPIGLTVCLACYATLPEDTARHQRETFNPIAALMITGGLACLIYVLLNWDDAGSVSWSTIGLSSMGIALTAFFIFRERNTADPLIPRRLLGSVNFLVANALEAVWSAGMFGSFVIFTLFLQRVLQYTPLQAGLAFTPNMILAGVLSATLSQRLVTRFGIRNSLQLGLLLVGAGLALLARTPIHANFWADVLPGMLLWGAGEGIASSPLLLAALRDVNKEDSGLASGVINTSLILGAALGLAFLVSSAQLRIRAVRIQDSLELAYAMAGGYHTALLIGAALTFLAAAFTKYALRETRQARNGEQRN